MHYVNNSGKVIRISFYGTKEYVIEPWATITLPEQMHTHILSRKIPLSINYPKHLSDLNNELITLDEFLEICWLEQYYG